MEVKHHARLYSASVCFVIGRFASAGDDGLVLIWNVEVSRTELYEYAHYMLMIW